MFPRITKTPPLVHYYLLLLHYLHTSFNFYCYTSTTLLLHFFQCSVAVWQQCKNCRVQCSSSVVVYQQWSSKSCRVQQWCSSNVVVVQHFSAKVQCSSIMVVVQHKIGSPCLLVVVQQFQKLKKKRCLVIVLAQQCSTFVVVIVCFKPMMLLQKKFRI